MPGLLGSDTARPAVGLDHETTPITSSCLMHTGFGNTTLLLQFRLPNEGFLAKTEPTRIETGCRGILTRKTDSPAMFVLMSVMAASLPLNKSHPKLYKGRYNLLLRVLMFPIGFHPTLFPSGVPCIRTMSHSTSARLTVSPLFPDCGIPGESPAACGRNPPFSNLFLAFSLRRKHPPQWRLLLSEWIMTLNV